MKALAIIAVIFAVGCSRADDIEKGAREKGRPAEQSSLDLALDGITGKAQLEAKRNAERKIREIYAKHNKKIEEALEE